MRKKESLAYLFFKAQKPGLAKEEVRRDVCEKILVSKISGSDLLRGQVVFKGGVFLSFLSGGARGFTKDIDLDLVHRPINEESLTSFFEEVNQSPLYPFATISLVPKSYEEIALADYHGARVSLLLSDDNDSFTISADIGLFDKLFDADSVRDLQITWGGDPLSIKAETNDLIIAEKLSTFAIYGTANERIKDLYDAYWLIQNTAFSKKSILAFLKAIVVEKRKTFINVKYALEKIRETLSDASYVKSFAKLHNWTGESGDIIASTVVAFVTILEKSK